MSSIGGTRDRMVNVKRGLPTGASTAANTLQDLKRMLDGMYNVRNETNAVTCVGHTHRSYTAFQGSIGQSANAMSTGDYNRAMDYMTTCTCDARQSSSCSCVSVNSGDYCSCNSRTANTCDCVSRSGGKYGGDCSCNSVYIGCNCEARTSSYVCSCNSRCSCNAVREFS